MVAKNDITGDSIRSKGYSKQGEDNFEAIFGKKPIGRGMSTARAEALGTDTPQDGDQRLNNEGHVERYYGGQWNATSQKEPT